MKLLLLVLPDDTDTHEVVQAVAPSQWVEVDHVKDDEFLPYEEYEKRYAKPMHGVLMSARKAARAAL